jgi:hypothetical protein
LIAADLSPISHYSCCAHPARSHVAGPLDGSATEAHHSRRCG